MRYLLDPITLFLFGILVLVLVDYSLCSYQCSSYGNMSSRETKFSYVSGCFVKTDRGWRNKNELREVGE